MKVQELQNRQGNGIILMKLLNDKVRKFLGSIISWIKGMLQYDSESQVTEN